MLNVWQATPKFMIQRCGLEDNLCYAVDKQSAPNASIIQRFHCVSVVRFHLHCSISGYAGKMV